ncbi:MAG: hypothetical protein KDE27_01625 [Planctomycetes bacterium]|nr:hypothetical protein [Planctomycetota bacterium]
MDLRLAPALLAAGMNEIQGLSGRAAQGRSLPLANVPNVTELAARSSLALAAGGATAATGAITNAAGQTLFDVREQLRDAVAAAIGEHGDAAGRGAAIEEAIRSALMANGFDPAELEAARLAPGFATLASVPAAASASPQSLSAALLGQGGPSLDEALFGGGKDDESGAEDFLQTLLGQFRAGVNLDLEV